jgi:ABC-type Zn2+ transport system substrate-binding protein/surface adhesin
VTDQWAEVDEHIVNRRIIRALKALGDRSGYTLHEALGVFNERYNHLRQTRPNDFTVSPEEYGRNVYT